MAQLGQLSGYEKLIKVNLIKILNLMLKNKPTLKIYREVPRQEWVPRGLTGLGANCWKFDFTEANWNRDFRIIFQLFYTAILTGLEEFWISLQNEGKNDS